VIGIVISREDTASMNIARFLLSSAPWQEKSSSLYCAGERVMYFIDDLHIYHDGVDRELASSGHAVDVIVFASRHASAAQKKTLTVHPIGNYGKAEYGGRDRTLVPSAPFLMRNALELLKEKNAGDYEVCYEATHHGPYLEIPCFFIEVGSTEKEWQDEQACRAIAETILEMEEKPFEVAIGIGGGHYAPCFTEIALERDVAFGHIAARYATGNLTDEMLEKMVKATPGCTKAYFHGTYDKIEEKLKEMGIEI